MKKVLIFGSGSIGNHMAFACRKIGMDVFITDISSKALNRMKNKIYPMRYKKWDKKIKIINYKEVFNFDDAGVPGFKGERKEKIVYKNSGSVLVNVILLPLMPLDIDAVYKQLSGYYKTLRSARKLESRSGAAADVIQFYGVDFFINNYELDIDTVYEFVLGAMENYDVERDFRNSNHSLVLESFKKFYESINK